MQTNESFAEHPAAGLLANRLTLLDIAGEIRGCERSARNLLDRLNIPFVKLVGRRLYDRDDVRRAILASETSRTPPRRGRPRKQAAA